MNFVQRAIGLIVKPDETMKDVIAAPRIEESLVIVAAYVVLLLIGAYVSLSHMNIVFTDSAGINAETLKMVMYVFGLGTVLVMTLLLWPIITAILHVFSMVFGGDGKFYPQILTGIGYSYLPKLIAAAIAIGLAAMLPVTTVELSSTGGYNIPSATSAGTLSLATTAVNLLFLLWSCYLGALAIKHGEKVSMTNALIVVGVPLVIYLLFTFGMGFLFRV